MTVRRACNVSPGRQDWCGAVSEWKNDIVRPAHAAVPDLLIPGFEILDTLGEGGHGTVYKARMVMLDRLVAVKVIKDDGSEDLKRQFERIQMEAKLLSKMKHPNIVQVFQVGVCADGRPFLACEYLDGIELSRLVAERGRLGKELLLSIFSQILEALQYAHENNLIHRDIKPGNIMIVEDKDSGKYEVKILDFGIARDMELKDRDNPGLTRSTILSGSPAYMSPEQCRGEKLEASSDLYSVACVMYECLCGEPPYGGGSILEVQYKHIHSEPDLSRPELKEAGEPALRLLGSALSKDPEKRPGTAAAFKLELQNAFGASGQNGTRSAGKAILLFLGLAVMALAALILVGGKSQPGPAGPFFSPPGMKEAKLGSSAKSKSNTPTARLNAFAERLAGIDVGDPSSFDGKKLMKELDEMLAQTRERDLRFAAYYLKYYMTTNAQEQESYIDQALKQCKLPGAKTAFEACYCYFLKSRFAGGRKDFREQERLLKEVMNCIEQRDSQESLNLSKQVENVINPSLQLVTIGDLAKNAEDQGRFEEALSYYSKSAEKGGNFTPTDIYINWAELLIKMKRLKEAKALIKRHIRDLKGRGSNLESTTLLSLAKDLKLLNQSGAQTILRQLRSFLYLARWQYNQGLLRDASETLAQGLQALPARVAESRYKRLYEESYSELKESLEELKKKGSVEAWDREKMPRVPSYLVGRAFVRELKK